MAFAFETSFITTSETAEHDDHDHDAVSESANGAHPKTHLITHIHADGTVHRHAVDDDELAEHLRESGGAPCWSMAIVVGVLPTLSLCPIQAILIGKIAMEALAPYRGTEPDVPGRPPRTPSIA